VVLNGAWLRDQAKTAIVAYFSPLTGALDDKLDRASPPQFIAQSSDRADGAVESAD
jgi:hypothetical protein